MTQGLPALASMIARGNGRAYGDSSLNPACVISLRRLDHLLALSDGGVLTCEAGALLGDVIDAVLRRGWFPPVTPGTKLVTIGGMIAADVHGKNHHAAGSFCDHLVGIELALPDGRVATCSSEDNPELFAATCGGMGLTGVILRASFQLTAVQTSKIRRRTIPACNLDQAMELLETSDAATYSVAWIDCLAQGERLGRSVIFLGEHARLEDLPPKEQRDPLARPPRRPRITAVDLPGFVLSRAVVQAFNEVYFRAHGAGTAVVDLDPYFYPLDTLHDWNRIYGPAGFVQYQPVLPLAESREGLRRLLGEITRAGGASFLAVLKRMGRQSFGMLSFPQPGYTLALDFPATGANLALLQRLDAIVAEHGGRIYLAKDASTSPAMMETGYPRLPQFRELRERLGLRARFGSLQSRRLEL